MTEWEYTEAEWSLLIFMLIFIPLVGYLLGGVVQHMYESNKTSEIILGIILEIFVIAYCVLLNREWKITLRECKEQSFRAYVSELVLLISFSVGLVTFLLSAHVFAFGK